MNIQPTPPTTADQDAVNSWLQDRELKDNKLGLARSGRGRTIDIQAAIVRLQEKAYTVFPQVERKLLDDFVRSYIDPRNLIPEVPRE